MSTYAQRVLYGTDLPQPSHPIRRVKGSYPATYIVNGKESLSKLPYNVKHAFSCSCGTIYAWRRDIEDDKDKRWRPLCPRCVELAAGEFLVRQSGARWKLADIPSDFCNAMGRENGVYVDVSLREGHMTLGFAVVQDEKAKFVSCSASNHICTSSAEREAVLLAQHHWPDLDVYCDCAQVCTTTGAKYIDRKRNDLAHRVARERINFKGWIAV